MQQHTRYVVYDGRSAGPLGRIVMALSAAAMAVVALVFGFFFFLAFLGLGLVVAAVMWFRLRGVRKDLRAAAETASRPGDSVIEGDFKVVDSRDAPDKTGP